MLHGKEKNNVAQRRKFLFLIVQVRIITVFFKCIKLNTLKKLAKIAVIIFYVLAQNNFNFTKTQVKCTFDSLSSAWQ